MDRRTFLASVGAAGLAGVAGCGSAASGGVDYDVGMTATAFDPDRIAVSVGEEVHWQNTSSRNHTVTAYEARLPEGGAFFASGDFESERAAREAFDDRLGGSIYSGESYRYTFRTPGEHDYFCIPHEQGGMIGTVVVEE